MLVPRHPQRFDAVAMLITARGLRIERRSSGVVPDTGTDVWLGDSLGEMFAYYAACDVAFIGGSLLDFGSQNLIQPAPWVAQIRSGRSPSISHKRRRMSNT